MVIKEISDKINSSLLLICDPRLNPIPTGYIKTRKFNRKQQKYNKK